MYPCLQSIVESQAAETESVFKSYSRVLVTASKNEGRLEPKDLSQLKRGLTALKRPIEQANADIAGLIELDAALQLASTEHSLREAFHAAAAEDDEVEVQGKLRTERNEAARITKQKAGTFNGWDYDAYMKEISDITDFRRIGHESTAPARAAALQAFDKARAASEQVKTLRAKLSQILNAIDSGPGDVGE